MENIKLSSFIEDKYVVENGKMVKVDNLDGQEIIFKAIAKEDVLNLGDIQNMNEAEFLYKLIPIMTNIDLDLTVTDFIEKCNMIQKAEFLELIDAIFAKYENLTTSIQTIARIEDRMNRLKENNLIETKEVVQEKSKEEIEGELVEAIKCTDDVDKMLELTNKLKELKEIK